MNGIAGVASFSCGWLLDFRAMRMRRAATVKQQNETASDDCTPRTIVPSWPV